jgi:uncharacterized protein YijF (DUF1287 family)
MTPRFAIGSLVLAACSAGSGAPQPTEASRPAAAAPTAPKAPAAEAAPAAGDPEMPEGALGIDDKGIWSDLDAQVQIDLPAGLTGATGVVTADGKVLVVYADDWPVKAYPLGGAATLAVGGETLALREGDASELAGVLGAVKTLAKGEHPAPGDRDGDDLPDPLDTLAGAKKTAAAESPYGGGYEVLKYPGGDLARDQGVCTDVVVRSLRNAGVDLQKEVHEDIARSKKSYPMVKGKGDASIDHRRVKTLLPWFKRHADAHTATLDDASDPYRPGDIVFLDTFPDKPGPDHIGVVSEHVGESGHLLVINSWTDGYVTQEMDLLGWVPVTHRFRL